MIVWDAGKNEFRRAGLKDLFEAIYALTMLIPAGKVTSYGEIAKVLDVSPRLVGLAMKRNDQPLIIPCHRVVGSRGELRGYSRGGVMVKKKLLELEGVLFRDGRVSESSMFKITDLIRDP